MTSKQQTAPRSLRVRGSAILTAALALLGGCSSADPAATSEPGITDAGAADERVRVVETSPPRTALSRSSVPSPTTARPVPVPTSAALLDPVELPEADQVAADRLAAAMQASSGLPMSESEASCVATRIVLDIGARRLVALGLDETSADASPLASLTPEEADTIADRLLGCVDVAGAILGALETDHLDEPDVACVRAAFDERVLANYAAADLQGELAAGVEAPLDAAADRLKTCLTPTQLDRMLGR